MLGGAERTGWLLFGGNPSLHVCYLYSANDHNDLTPTLVDAYKLNNGTYQVGCFIHGYHELGGYWTFLYSVYVGENADSYLRSSFSSAVIILQVVVWKVYH